VLTRIFLRTLTFVYFGCDSPARRCVPECYNAYRWHELSDFDSTSGNRAFRWMRASIKRQVSKESVP
jgi:hypothetical protein